MPIDFTRKLTNPMDGSDIAELGREGKVENLTLARAACTALLVETPQEPATDPKEHARRFTIAMRILADPTAVSLEAAEIVLIKTRIARAYKNAMVAGQAVMMIDPNTLVAEEKAA